MADVLGIVSSATDNLSRSAAHQANIEKFAKEACSYFPGMYDQIASRVGGSPKFTASEGRHFVSSQNVNMMDDATGVNGNGYPILQLYDYCTTIDSTVNRLLDLQRRVKSGEWNVGNDHHGSLAARNILRPDFRPPFYEGGAAQLDSRGQSITTGQAINTPNIYESRMQSSGQWILPSTVLNGAAAGAVPVHGAANVRGGAPYFSSSAPAGGRPISRAKTKYERCVEEAYLLSFEPINNMVALAQGLFRRQLTSQIAAQVIGAAGVPAAPAAGAADLIGHWVNEFEANSAAEFNGNAGGVLNVDHHVVAPKVTRVAVYQGNRYEREGVAHPEVAVPANLKNFDNGALVNNRHLLPAEGGACGLILACQTAIATDYAAGQWPGAVNFQPPRGLRMGLVGQDGVAARMVIVPTEAYEITTRDIWAQMDRMRNHLIYACPAFGRAMKKVELDYALLSLYKSVQVSYWGAYRRSQKGLTGASFFDMAARTGCPGGGAVAYRTQGPKPELVSGNDAFLQGPEGKVLRPDIDPGSRMCIGANEDPFDSHAGPSFEAMCWDDGAGATKDGDGTMCAGRRGRRRRRSHSRRRKSKSRSRSRRRKSKSRSRSRRRKSKSRSRSRRRKSKSRSRSRRRKSKSRSRSRRRRSHSRKRRSYRSLMRAASVPQVLAQLDAASPSSSMPAPKGGMPSGGKRKSRRKRRGGKRKSKKKASVKAAPHP
jgi:hypothetical protein